MKTRVPLRVQAAFEFIRFISEVEAAVEVMEGVPQAGRELRKGETKALDSSLKVIREFIDGEIPNEETGEADDEEGEDDTAKGK